MLEGNENSTIFSPMLMKSLFTQTNQPQEIEILKVDCDLTWNTLQPVNHGPGKRRSVSKLTDKDILNDKVGQYNLTTQGQDTDGELETKVYKVRNKESVSTCIAFLKPSMNPKIPVRGPGFQDSGLGPRGSIVGSVVLAAPKFVMKYFCKMAM